MTGYSVPMANGRWSFEEIRCVMLWRLARNHGWATWTPEEDLTRAVPSHERGRARSIADSLRGERLVTHHPSRGFKISHEEIERLARLLRDVCGISEFQIEATLSHFRGFE